MNRIFRILLLVLLLGPSVGQVLRHAQEICAEAQRDCCDPKGLCQASCAECACCAVPAITLETAASTGIHDAAPLPTAVAAVVAPPLAPPSDILHIPKSA